MTASQHGVRGRGRATLYAGVVLTCLLLAPAQFRAVGGAQEILQEGKPPTRESLLGALKAEGKLPSRKPFVPRFIRLIHEYGIKFRFTPADEKDVRKAGSFLTVNDLDSLVAALKRADYRPATTLSGNIEQVRVTDDPGGGILVFVRLSVKNDGPPSIVQDFKLRVVQSTLPPLEVKGSTPSELDVPFPMPREGGEGEVTIRPEESLALMTREAVGKGRHMTGWLKFKLPSLRISAKRQLRPEDLRQRGLWYVVTFTDRAGEPYESTYEMK